MEFDLDPKMIFNTGTVMNMVTFSLNVVYPYYRPFYVAATGMISTTGAMMQSQQANQANQYFAKIAGTKYIYGNKK